MSRLLLFFIVIASVLRVQAQQPIDITPPKKTDAIITGITSDLAGNIYTAFTQDAKVHVQRYDGKSWTDLPGAPNMKLVQQLVGTASGVAVFGIQDYNRWKRLLHHWDGSSWTSVPLEQLSGEVKNIVADKQGNLFVSGLFKGSKNFGLARWDKPRLVTTGFPLPAQEWEKRFEENLGLYNSFGGKGFLFHIASGEGNPKHVVAFTGETGWVYFDSETFPLKFSYSLLAVNDNEVFVVTDCHDTKNRCILKVNTETDSTWQLLPFNDSWQNGEVKGMAIDPSNRLIVAGTTRSSKGYVALRWDGKAWSQFGPAIDKPMGKILLMKDKLYAITGDNGTSITMIPAYEGNVGPTDPPGTFAAKDPKAQEVLNIALQYIAQEDSLLRKFIDDCYKFFTTNYPTDEKLQSLLARERNLGGMIYGYRQAFDKLKLKKQKNMLVEHHLQQRMNAAGNVLSSAFLILYAIEKGNKHDAKKYETSLTEAMNKYGDVWINTKLYIQEYKIRNGLQ